MLMLVGAGYDGAVPPHHGVIGAVIRSCAAVGPAGHANKFCSRWRSLWRVLSVAYSTSVVASQGIQYAETPREKYACCCDVLQRINKGVMLLQ